MANAIVLVAHDSDTTLNSQVEELWRTYADTLTLLASVFLVDELEAVRLNYLLDEDERTLSFLPFRHKITSRRYYKEGGLSQKPRHHESDSAIQPHHPIKEMLARVRDLLADGKVMDEQEVW